MRRFDVVVAAALVACLVSCTRSHLSSPDGLELGVAHPLLEHHAPTVSGSSARGARFDPPLDPKALEGKVVVVHFWATWADGTRAILPKLQALYAKYKDRGVEIVALSVDDDAASIDEVVQSSGVRFPVAWDARKEVVRQWFVKSVPASFVVDRRGVVRAAFIGYEDGVEVEIETDVKLLAAEGPSLARK